jgi:NADH-quinone oxidoreductase subunit M
MTYFDSLLSENILSLILFIPFLYGVLSLLAPQKVRPAMLPGALVVTLIELLLTIYLFNNFNGSAGFEFVEIYPWIIKFGITYQVGVDGISIYMILLTAFMIPLALISTWGQIDFKGKSHVYVFLVMMLQSTMLGAFMALDIFLFYVFWELMLIPMYFIIGKWGGLNRIYAAMKFFIYTMFGSVLMLVAIFWLINSHIDQFGFASASLLDLYKLQIPFASGFLSPQILLFAAFTIAFAIKVPLFPFHTWLPDAHVQAPTFGSIILAGVLLKFGIYGFIRVAIPLFPEASRALAPWLSILAVIGIVYGAMLALAQSDIKKLVAYSSVSHMGFIMLGVFAGTDQAMAGAVYQMINHGISTGGLFMVVGYLYSRKHTRELDEYGGLASVTPLLGTFYFIMIISSAAVPATNGFVGEFMILSGAFITRPVLSAIGATGVVLGAVYLLKAYQKVMFGPISKENESIPDLNLREISTLAVLSIFVFYIGFFPNSAFSKSKNSIKEIVRIFNSDSHVVSKR